MLERFGLVRPEHVSTARYAEADKVIGEAKDAAAESRRQREEDERRVARLTDAGALIDRRGTTR